MSEIDALLAAVRPGVVDLARRASLAARAEPALLRALRLELRPRLDAGTEGDLWFSPLVEVRGADGIVLRAPVAEKLREQLASSGSLEAAWRITERIHAGSAPAIQLEERIAWLALSSGDKAAIDAELQRALVALVQQGRRGIANWALRALPRMPRMARDTAAGWLLAMRTSRDTGRKIALEGQPPPGLSDVNLASIVPNTGDVELGVLRTGRELHLGEVGGPPAISIAVPDTDPRYVEVQFARERRIVAIRAGDQVTVDVLAGPISLRSADHRVYELPGVPLVGCFIASFLDDAKWGSRLIERLNRFPGLVLYHAVYPNYADRYSQGGTRGMVDYPIVIPLISPAFLKSKWEKTLFENAMSLKSRILPLLIRRAPIRAWKGLAALQALPNDGVPLAARRDPEAALDAIAIEINAVAEQLRSSGRTITVAKTGAGYRTIAEALAHAQPHDLVRVKRGHYLENVQLPDDVSLEGDGAESTTIDGGGKGWVVRMAKGASLSRFTIRGSGSEDGVNDAGVMMEMCDGAVVDDNHITGNGHYGVILRRCQGANLIANVIEDNGVLGIYADQDAQFLANRNVIARHRHSALDIVGARVTCDFSHNTLAECGAGIVLESDAVDLMVTNNLFSGMKHGIEAPAAIGEKVKQNLFSEIEVPHFDWSSNRSVPLQPDNILMVDIPLARGTYRPLKPMPVADDDTYFGALPYEGKTAKKATPLLKRPSKKAVAKSRTSRSAPVPPKKIIGDVPLVRGKYRPIMQLPAVEEGTYFAPPTRMGGPVKKKAATAKMRPARKAAAKKAAPRKTPARKAAAKKRPAKKR